MWTCERCGSSVNELIQCDIYREMICERCLDPFVGACTSCVSELYNGNMRCGICGVSIPVSALKECVSCGRKVCDLHFYSIHVESGDIICDNCGYEGVEIGGVEVFEYVQEHLVRCAHCGQETIEDETTIYCDRCGGPLCPECEEGESDEDHKGYDAEY